MEQLAQGQGNSSSGLVGMALQSKDELGDLEDLFQPEGFHGSYSIFLPHSCPLSLLSERGTAGAWGLTSISSEGVVFWV